MVRAVAAVRYSAPDGIEVIDAGSRPPGPGEVVIEVRAAALNPYDAKQVNAGADPDKLPLRLGSEASGVITQAGSEAIGLEGQALMVGDAVYGHRLPGAQASELTVPADRLLRKPPHAPFEQAAGLLVVGTTAVHALETVQVTADDTVLIHGAAGSVGTLTARLALLRGARVIGTAAARRHAGLAALGVTPVEYGDGLLDRVRALVPEGVTAAIDTVGTDEALATSLALLPSPARLVTIANFTATLDAGGKAIGGGPGADPGSDIRAAARLHLAQLFAAGELSVPVSATYPFGRVREAYTELMAGHAGGKIVLVP